MIVCSVCILLGTKSTLSGGVSDAISGRGMIESTSRRTLANLGSGCILLVSHELQRFAPQLGFYSRSLR
jgi:hypothetical protein